MNKLERQNLVSHISSDYFEAFGAISGKSRTLVYVEGWDDIAFWRSVFDDFEQDSVRQFEIMTPVRSDMAKGKKVVLQFADRAGQGLILCVDSDFDYLFDQLTYQSRTVNNNPYVVQTYTYSIENLLCLPTSLPSIVAKITKNDSNIFDFEEFFRRYSETIYPVFLWYVFASRIDKPNIFTLTEFRNVVRINYIHIDENGERTIEWLEKQVTYRLNQLKKKHPEYRSEVAQFEKVIIERGVKKHETHLYMQGHTLLDNVVKTVVQAVCNELRNITVDRINRSKSEIITKRNELGAYNNALRDIDSVILDNVIYKRSYHYNKIVEKINNIKVNITSNKNI